MSRKDLCVIPLIVGVVLSLFYVRGLNNSDVASDPLISPIASPIYGDSILEEMKYMQQLAEEKLAEQQRQEELQKQEEEKEQQKQEVESQTQSGGAYLGNFRISHYCSCRKCNGGYTSTASGNPLTVGTTIAVDRNVIPLGSTVYIDGYGVRVAHDTGSAIKGNRIDVLVDNHDEAYRLGVVYRDVYLQ